MTNHYWINLPRPLSSQELDLVWLINQTNEKACHEIEDRLCEYFSS